MRRHRHLISLLPPPRRCSFFLLALGTFFLLAQLPLHYCTRRARRVRVCHAASPRGMGGQDLLPPAKAGGVRRSRSTLKVTALVSTIIIVTLLYATERTHRPPTPAPGTTQHPETAATVFSPPPPSPQPVAAAAEAAVAAVASPSVISLKLQAGSGGKEHTLRLRLLPEHSAPSVEFMRCAALLKGLASPCTCTAHARHHARRPPVRPARGCHIALRLRLPRFAATHQCGGELYRSEKDFLVQGRISCGGSGAAPPRVVKGTCPAGVVPDGKRACPKHDPNCGCHGPLMSKGMVGWAGGGAGPDLFIYTASRSCAVGSCPATHWCALNREPRNPAPGPWPLAPGPWPQTTDHRPPRRGSDPRARAPDPVPELEPRTRARAGRATTPSLPRSLTMPRGL